MFAEGAMLLFVLLLDGFILLLLLSRTAFLFSVTTIPVLG